MPEQPFSYGGQAVIEGVMIRGRRFSSLAVRRMNGEIHAISEPLNQIYSGRLRQVPFVRGILVLIETMVLGIKALNRSAAMVLEDQTDGEEEVPRLLLAVTLLVAFTLGIGLFFIMPLFAVRTFETHISSKELNNLIEGLFRLVVLVAYVGLIGLLKDIKRVFAYHGAEHMAVHTHEAGLPLEVDNVQRFSTAHPRCGTAFLLTVMLVAILVFTFIPRDNLTLLILSRIVLIPVIAAISYEVIKFSGAHHSNPLTKAIVYPGMLLQSLTTRTPDKSQVEVAIHAMKTALAADQGEPLPIHESVTSAATAPAGEPQGGEGYAQTNP